MDEMIKKILIEKLNSSYIPRDSVFELLTSSNKVDSDSLLTGILIGRLYNSFFYQHRRILKRDPSENELIEFIDFIKNNLELFSR